MKTFQQSAYIFVGLILSCLMLAPIWIMMTSSLKPLEDIFNMQFFPGLRSITLQNYMDVFKLPFGKYTLNTIFTTVTITVMSLFFHSMAAFALAKLRFPGKSAVFILILSTLMIPFSVIMIPLFLIITSMGLINTYAAIILPAIPNAFGIFLFRQFMVGVPNELLESAKIDGASYFRIYYRIMLPLTKPIMMTLAIVLFLWNWNNYVWPLIVAQDSSLWLLQIAIANLKGQYTADWNKILAASFLVSVPPIVLFALLQKYVVDGIKMTGVKG